MVLDAAFRPAVLVAKPFLCGGGTSRVLKTGTGGRAGTGAACRALVSQFLAAGQAFTEVKPKTEGHSSCGVG